MKIALVFLLLVVTAQFPSCGNILGGGGDDKIVGYVEDKYVAPDREGGPAVPWIVIDRRDYNVPWNFYRSVNVGDLVKRENGRWSIIKKYVP